jgi:hypothetical protein
MKLINYNRRSGRALVVWVVEGEICFSSSSHFDCAGFIDMTQASTIEKHPIVDV